MDKESIYELQKIDCSCNDCKHLVRNNYKKKIQDDWWASVQKVEFDTNREAELSLAMIIRDKTMLATELKKQFKPQKSLFSYGYCKKFDFKEVSFTPNVCSLETQECFEHRK